MDMNIMTSNRQEMLSATERFLSIEKIFFQSSNNENIDYSRIDVDSETYDRDYDIKVRKNEVNYLYLLDEIISTYTHQDCGIVTLLSYIEDYLIDSLGKPDKSAYNTAIAKALGLICDHSKEYLLILKNGITDNEYNSIIRDYSCIMPPANKQEFFDNISSTIKSIEKQLGRA